MARVTVRMDEAVWLRARDAAALMGKSLSRFVTESLERRLAHAPALNDAGEPESAGSRERSADEGDGPAPTRSGRGL